MDTKTYLQVPGKEEADKYTASIELSNACRTFYKSRMETAEAMKQKWEKNSVSATDANGNGKQKNSIDLAMERLREEMASLMDQDLSLMKQLLTLNESIEDLKWQRKYYYSSVQSSSCEDSDWSVSETEMYDSDSDVATKYPTPSSLSLQSAKNKRFGSDDSTTDNGFVHSSDQTLNLNLNKNKFMETDKRFVETQIMVNGSSYKSCHGEQNSFDSGIHDPCCEVEIRV